MSRIDISKKIDCGKFKFTQAQFDAINQLSGECDAIMKKYADVFSIKNVGKLFLAWVIPPYKSHLQKQLLVVLSEYVNKVISLVEVFATASKYKDGETANKNYTITFTVNIDHKFINNFEKYNKYLGTKISTDTIYGQYLEYVSKIHSDVTHLNKDDKGIEEYYQLLLNYRQAYSTMIDNLPQFKKDYKKLHGDGSLPKISEDMKGTSKIEVKIEMATETFSDFTTYPDTSTQRGFISLPL